MKKRWNVIGVLLVLLFFSYCGKRETKQIDVQTSDVLAGVDSLMWQRPDSALACLLPYFDTCCRDVSRNVSETENGGISEDVSGNVSTDFNRHYAHLLLAELLYKNDYAQTNRAELRQAVGYFDSLSLILNDHSHASWRHCGLDPQSPKWDDNIVFLTARAHYINGVGYYEHDSVVEACEEYLKALEVMEDRFEEKELVGKKAQFLAYTFNRLGDLFSELFMIEPTIECYEKSLALNLIKTTSLYGIANANYHLGIQYDVLGQKEKAFQYYEQAKQSLPDTNNCLFRDIAASMTLLDYQMNNDTKKSLKVLHRLISHARDDAEKGTRSLVVGTLYFEERQYDSALLYLEQAYKENKNITVRIQVVEYLLNIYQSLGDESKVKECTSFLSQYTVIGIEQKAVQSQLTDLYQDYLRKRSERQIFVEKTKHQREYILFSVLLVILFVMATVFVSRGLHSKKLKSAELKHDAELNDLRGINHLLQEENQKLAKGLEHIPEKTPRQEYDALLGEPICMNLLQRFGRMEILTTNKPKEYKALAITPKERQALAKTVMKHCPNYDLLLKMQYPKIKVTDLDVCRFLLIGLSEQQVAVLLQKDYSTIWKKVKRLREMMGFVEPKTHLIRLLFESEVTK